MNVEVTKPAISWFKEEFGEEESVIPIRLYGRYGGCGSLQSGFSLGISQIEPVEPLLKKEIDGFLFFVEQQDGWYFNDHSVKIKYSRKYDEIEFVYDDV